LAKNTRGVPASPPAAIPSVAPVAPVAALARALESALAYRREIVLALGASPDPQTALALRATLAAHDAEVAALLAKLERVVPPESAGCA
jgi:hypothetical protein